LVLVVGPALDPESVALEEPGPSVLEASEEPEVCEGDAVLLLSLEPVPVGELVSVPVLPGAEAPEVVAAEPLMVLVDVVGSWAPHGLFTRHAFWQVESWAAQAATHWLPYSVHSKYGIV
jgi:hypothetical protein